MSAVEENVKMLSRDHDIYKNTIQSSGSSVNSLDAYSGVSIRGTKDLMKNIQSAIKEQKEKSIDEEDEEIS